MNTDVLFSIKDKETLKLARKTYGAHKQIGVAAEECTELAKELIKAFRYDDFEDAVYYTKENIVDEVADVLIVLDHVLELYRIKEKDLIPQVSKKIDRLRYWLENSNSIEFTTKVREVESSYCVCRDCDYKNELKEAFSSKICENCRMKDLVASDEVSRV